MAVIVFGVAACFWGLATLVCVLVVFVRGVNSVVVLGSVFVSGGNSALERVIGTCGGVACLQGGIVAVNDRRLVCGFLGYIPIFCEFPAPTEFGLQNPSIQGSDSPW